MSLFGEFGATGELRRVPSQPLPSGVPSNLIGYSRLGIWRYMYCSQVHEGYRESGRHYSLPDMYAFGSSGSPDVFCPHHQDVAVLCCVQVEL